MNFLANVKNLICFYIEEKQIYTKSHITMNICSAGNTGIMTSVFNFTIFHHFCMVFNSNSIFIALNLHLKTDSKRIKQKSRIL